MQAAEHLPISGPRVEDILSARPDQKYYEKARIFAPPCECADCQNGFYTSQEQRIDCFAYKKRISDAEAKRILGAHVGQAQEDREYLRQLCGSHGDRIMSRWKKRSRDKRQNLLLHANPDLYMHRWFIPRLINDNPPWRDARKLRQSHLLPYLSVDLLKKDPAVFLGLLYNRTHYTPDMWASSDSKELLNAWVQGLFDVDFHEGCVVPRLPVRAACSLGPGICPPIRHSWIPQGPAHHRGTGLSSAVPPSRCGPDTGRG